MALPSRPPAHYRKVDLMQYGFGQVQGPAPDTGTGTILYIEDLTVSFDGFKALNGLTLYVDDGELRCLIGLNGAGKTTLMDVITGKTRPQRGTAYFGHNIDLLSLSEPEIATAGIGRKFQRPTVFEHQTVFENLWLALHANKAVWPTLVARLGNEARERIDEVLATIGLSAVRERRAGALAHGQKQWLEIGMLLMQAPRLLLLDEPVAGMTHQEIEHTVALLGSLAGRHTIIVVDHDMEFVRSIGRRVTVLHEGRVLAEGKMQDVQQNPKVIEVYLGDGRGGDGQGEMVMGEMPVGAVQGAHMPSIVDLNQYYGESHTLWDLTLEVPEGSCTCLMGRNGVGKSTLLKCAMGLLPIRSGTLRFDGEELTRLPAHERATLGIGYVPQGREIFPLLTVEENLRVGLCVESRRARRSRAGRSRASGNRATGNRKIPARSSRPSRCSRTCSTAATAIFRAASSNNSPSAARWSWSHGSSSSMSRPRASSPTSSPRSATSSCASTATRVSRCSSSSRSSPSRDGSRIGFASWRGDGSWPAARSAS